MPKRSKKPLHELDVFSTGQAAKACGISQQTINRCFDNGLLKGFLVPGSKFRKIPRANLMAFMESNGIPMDTLKASPEIALHMLTTQELLEAVQQKSENENITAYNNPMDLGLSMRDIAGTLVVDGRVVRPESLSSIAKSITTIRQELPNKLRSIGILSKVNTLQPGGTFDDVLFTSKDDATLAQQILDLQNGN